ncbi:MAG: N-acetylneuraminate synthase family protein [Phycisphaerae bacterium]
MASPAPAQAADNAVTIGGHKVGVGEPTFIVAEAGVNHNGDVGTALRLVDLAADAGADAVKFQMFQAADLVTASAPVAQYQQRGSPHRSQLEMLAQLELTQKDFASIRDRCEARSILFLATPFSERDVERLQELGVEAIKIASTDLTNNALLEAAARTRLPILLSTGASTAVEIRNSVSRLCRPPTAGRPHEPTQPCSAYPSPKHRRGVNRPIACAPGSDQHHTIAHGGLVLLHCISCYPTPVAKLNLRAIRALSESFSVPCGLSDHSLSVRAGGWALAAGACLLEKHFTLDRTAPGPDHAISLDAAQLTEYIATVREAESALGSGKLGMSDAESEVREVARRSIVSTTPIAAGTRITADMLTLKRPGTGIPPGDMCHLLDRQTARDIPADTLLSWDMFE